MNPFHFGSEKGGVLLKLDLFNPIYTPKQTQGLKNTNSIFLLFLSFTKFQWHILVDHCRSTHVCRIWKIGNFFVGTFGSGNKQIQAVLTVEGAIRIPKLHYCSQFHCGKLTTVCSFLFNADSQKNLSNNSTY